MHLGGGSAAAAVAAADANGPSAALRGWAVPLALGAAGAAELRAKACYLGCLLQAELATGRLCHFGRK